MTHILVANLLTDPDITSRYPYLTLERSDGRSVWRQRLKLVRKTSYGYMFEAVNEAARYENTTLTDEGIERWEKP